MSRGSRPKEAKDSPWLSMNRVIQCSPGSSTPTAGYSYLVTTLGKSCAHSECLCAHTIDDSIF